MNSGKAKAVCSPVKAAADRYGPLAPAGIERPPGSGPSGRAARSACGMRALIGRGKLECKVRVVWVRSNFGFGSMPLKKAAMRGVKFTYRAFEGLVIPRAPRRPKGIGNTNGKYRPVVF